MQVRVAVPADLPSLVRRQEVLIGLAHPWEKHLGDGADRQTPMALVACWNGEPVGHIGAGPLDLDPDPLYYRSPGAADSQTLAARAPWWKLYSLAVDSADQGTGVGLALLRALLARMPGDLIGLYGAVEINRPATHAWYRRQGFYLAPEVALRMRESDTDPLIGLRAFPGQVFFYGYRHTIAEHLAGRGRASFADRIAREALRRQIRSNAKVWTARADTGYRQFVNRLADQTSFPTCPHAGLGPRPLLVLAWDPQLRRVCSFCQLEHTSTVRQYDADNHCDGCQQTRPDVVLSWAVNDSSLLIVHAGLCAACRAGLPSDPLQRY